MNKGIIFQIIVKTKVRIETELANGGLVTDTLYLFIKSRDLFNKGFSAVNQRFNIAACQILYQKSGLFNTIFYKRILLQL